ncbi:hypothetical protein [Robertmurraya korlensis]|jgi:hypothetical protein|nr:hypothetical protein [Robertmurraya korlensis]
MSDQKQSANDIKYSIWETRTDEKHSLTNDQQKEAIDLPDPKETK